MKRLVLTDDSMDLVERLIAEQPKPTAAMLGLFSEEPDLVWTIETAPRSEESREALPQPSRT